MRPGGQRVQTSPSASSAPVPRVAIVSRTSSRSGSAGIAKKVEILLEMPLGNAFPAASWNKRAKDEPDWERRTSMVRRSPRREAAERRGTISSCRTRVVTWRERMGERAARASKMQGQPKTTQRRRQSGRRESKRTVTRTATAPPYEWPVRRREKPG